MPPTGIGEDPLRHLFTPPLQRGRGAVPAVVVAIGIFSIASAGHAQPVPQPWNFSKQALGSNGAPLTGPVSIGDTLTYVLSYSPGSLPSGPIVIGDTFSPNQVYVNPSIAAPPNWSWNPGPGPLPPVPYGVGNHETYSTAGFGPGTSFIVNVLVSDRAQVGQTGGDGTLPIPLGNRAYGLLHHLNAGPGAGAKIMCWDLSSLVTCQLPPGGPAPWPRTVGQDLMTPTLLRHVVVGTRIYFPTARVVGSGATATTTPGIGCWNTATETACLVPFTPLPGGPVWVGNPPSGSPSGLDPLLAGVALDPALGRLLMYAVNSSSAPTVGKIYCVPLSGSCTGWLSPATLTAGGNSLLT